MWKFTAFLWAILITPAFSTTHKVPADDPIATIEISDKWQTQQLGEGIEAISPTGASPSSSCQWREERSPNR